MDSQPPSLAVFDMDGTLTQQDSLGLFLLGVAGWPCFIWAFFTAFLCHGLWSSDRRTRIKAAVLRKILAGRDATDIARGIDYLLRHIRWQDDVVARYRQHLQQGHRLVVATGALDIYTPALLASQNLRYDALLATEMAWQDGRLTGAWLGENAVRAVKQQRVRDWLAANQPFARRYGYGNAPHDLPMLALMDEQHII